MTLILETLTGEEIATGFWGPDTSRVQLGELPLMTTQQFAGFAALALSQEIIPQLEPERRGPWSRVSRVMYEEVISAPLRPSTGKYFAVPRDELLAQLDTVAPEDERELTGEAVASAVPTPAAVYYSETPFVVQADGQRVGFRNEDEVKAVITAENFFIMSSSVIGGGIMGWGRYGTWQEVKDAATQINDSLHTS